jgi:hypothetical protein
MGGGAAISSFSAKKPGVTKNFCEIQTKSSIKIDHRAFDPRTIFY